MPATPFDHPLLSGLLGDDEVARQFSAEAEIDAMRHFEAALARAEAAEGLIPEAAAEAISRACAFAPDFEALGAGATRDGVIGPDLVKQLRRHVPAPHDQWLHFGATSQDLADTSLVLRLRPLLPLFDARLAAVEAALDDLVRRFDARPLMAHTRMQPAIPITVGDRLAAWRGPLPRHRRRLAELTPRLLVLQFGGAAGTRDKLGDKGDAVARRLAEALGLGLPDRPWHTQRDSPAEFAGWLSLVTGSLGKIGIDIALMAELGEVALADGGTSSAMPHKQNPVGAEVLVALARHNATLLSGMHQALVHEQERSGAAWTLEWLTLPQMVVTTAASVRSASTLLGGITSMGKRP